MNTYSRRVQAISPESLPEHLRGIREQVVGKHTTFTESSAPSESDYAEVVMIVARAKELDEADRDKLLDYLESTHRSAKSTFERYQSLIDGIINWAGWAANWTRRNGSTDTKAPVETPLVKAE